MVKLVPVTACLSMELETLAQAFRAEDGHPLDEEAMATLRSVACGHPSARAWLIKEHDRTVGYALVTLGFSVDYGGVDAFLDDLYLVPDTRGRGLGDLVMELITHEVVALGVKALHLVVHKINQRAQRLYHRHGFEATDWLLMSRRLTDTPEPAGADIGIESALDEAILDPPDVAISCEGGSPRPTCVPATFRFEQWAAHGERDVEHGDRCPCAHGT